MFDNLIVQPIFNLLVLINALIPRHNFGIALIVFTVLVRFLMWPIVRKQLHHSKAMRDLQPEIKRIKKENKGNRQQESAALMNLYKERNISPTGSIGILIIQFIILIGLYFAVRKMVNDPHSLLNFSYTWTHGFPWLKDLAANINSFDETLLGLIDLTKPALSGGHWYFPALLLVIGSAFAQFKQSTQLMPKPKDNRGLKQILTDAASGKEADQMEVNAAVMRSTRFLIPAMILLFTIGLPSALSLYWMVGGIVGYLQQSHILKQDEEEMEAIADTPSGQKTVIEGEVIEKKHTPKPKKKKSSKSSKKRRK
jgi:YidC/Oxa1 family membrane protein insertase